MLHTAGKEQQPNCVDLALINVIIFHKTTWPKEPARCAWIMGIGGCIFTNGHLPVKGHNSHLYPRYKWAKLSHQNYLYSCTIIGALRPSMYLVVCACLLLDVVNGYQCNCAVGWTGTNCDVNINDCSPNSCLNGGFCQVSYVNVYIRYWASMREPCVSHRMDNIWPWIWCM